jgi:hypothetical protein
LWTGLSSTKPGVSLRSSSLAPGYVADLTEWHTFRTFSICYEGSEHDNTSLCQPVPLICWMNSMKILPLENTLYWEY